VHAQPRYNVGHGLSWGVEASLVVCNDVMFIGGGMRLRALQRYIRTLPHRCRLGCGNVLPNSFALAFPTIVAHNARLRVGVRQFRAQPASERQQQRISGAAREKPARGDTLATCTARGACAGCAASQVDRGAALAAAENEADGKRIAAPAYLASVHLASSHLAPFQPCHERASCCWTNGWTQQSPRLLCERASAQDPASASAAGSRSTAVSNAFGERLIDCLLYAFQPLARSVVARL
jgi:hypothetical protein